MFAKYFLIGKMNKKIFSYQINCGYVRRYSEGLPGNRFFKALFSIECLVSLLLFEMREPGGLASHFISAVLFCTICRRGNCLPGNCLVKI